MSVTRPQPRFGYRPEREHCIGARVRYAPSEHASGVEGVWLDLDEGTIVDGPMAVWLMAHALAWWDPEAWLDEYVCNVASAQHDGDDPSPVPGAGRDDASGVHIPCVGSLQPAHRSHVA